MKTLVLAGAAAALLMASAGAASAAVVLTFDPGPAHSPSAGFTLIDTFDSAANIGGSNFQIGTTDDGNGAPPANSVPFDSSYLSVKGPGGGASIQFSDLTSKTVEGFEFDWGSVDSYNTLVIHYTDAGGAEKETVIPGTSFPNLANGNQVADGTNGLFIVTGTAGETFQGIVLTSGQNSFEIDNLAIAVPEPSAWAMMLLGIGGLGAVLRNRRKALSPA